MKIIHPPLTPPIKGGETKGRTPFEFEWGKIKGKFSIEGEGIQL